MIVALTTREHRYTLRSLARGRYGVPTPPFAVRPYERLWRATRVPRATYLFCDLERLAPWELRRAGALFRALTAAGLHCVNDPARVLSRLELLQALHAAGMNPFTAHRAEERPRPARFPVFLRGDGEHSKPISGLLETQEALDRSLDQLQVEHTPLRGLLVVELCAEPYRPGLWAKWGTFRVGQEMAVEHLVVDDSWLVKHGDRKKMDDAVLADERDGIETNRFAAAVAPAFEIAGIAFGRADHSTVGGCTVVYEINTNPFIGRFVREPNPKRRPAQLAARKRFAAALETIDTPDTGTVALERTPLRQQIRSWRLGLLFPRRP